MAGAGHVVLKTSSGLGIGISKAEILDPHNTLGAADSPLIDEEEGLKLEDAGVTQTVGGVIVSLFDNLSAP